MRVASWLGAIQNNVSHQHIANVRNKNRKIIEVLKRIRRLAQIFDEKTYTIYPQTIAPTIINNQSKECQRILFVILYI